MPSTVPRAIALTLTVLAISSWFFPAAAEAQSRWVNDEIRINFRAGPGDQFRILRHFNTGARLELATPPADRFPEGSPDGWLYLRDAQGNEGWAREQFLVAQPPARVRITAVERERDQARTRVEELTGELRASSEEKTELERALEASRAQIAELERSFDAARRGFELFEEHEALQATIAELEARKADLREENKALADRSLKEWFLIGAGVLAAGILLGLILPRLRRRQDPWGRGSL